MSRINFESLKVEINLRDKGNMVAQAAIEFAGVRVTHFRIMVDKKTGEVWLELPSIRVYAKYQRCFWVLDDNDYSELQKLVLDKYSETVSKVKAGEIQDTTPLAELSDISDTQ